MRMHSRTNLLLLLIFISLVGCVANVPVRASSSQHLSLSQSSAVFPWSPGVLEQAYKKLMQQKNLTLAHALDAPDGSKVLVYKGKRVNVLSVRGSSMGFRAETYEVGSWIAARISTHSEGSTIVIFGKPTVQGVSLCSDDDAQLSDVQYFCQDTKVREDYEHMHLLNAKAEAEFISALLEELKDASKHQKHDTDMPAPPTAI